MSGSPPRAKITAALAREILDATALLAKDGSPKVLLSISTSGLDQQRRAVAP